MNQQAMMKDDSIEIGNNSDTSFGAGSLKAARSAAGAMQHSVDRGVIFIYIYVNFYVVLI